MAMVGRSHCQVLVPGCPRHQDDPRDEGEGDIDEHEDKDESVEEDLEDYAPVIIGVSGRGEGETKS